MTISKIQKLINKKEILFILFISIYYVLFVVPSNLNDDHGIIIISGIQTSENNIPGIDFPYPHGLIPPLILGFFIKITTILGFEWQYAYIFLSLILFLLFVFEIKKILINLFNFNYSFGIISAGIISCSLLYPWGGYYHDYLSLLICLLTINYLYFLISKYKSKNTNSKKAILFEYIFLGIVLFVNPLFIKLSSIYLSFFILITISLYIFYLPKKDYFKVLSLIFIGLILIPTFLIIFEQLNWIDLKLLIRNLYEPIFFATDLNNYTILKLPTNRSFLIPFISMGFISFMPLLNSNEKFNLYNTKLISRFIFLLFSYSYISVWLRDQTWLIVLTLLLIINLFLEKISYKKVLKKNFYIVLSLLFIFNLGLFVRFKNLILYKKRFFNKELLDLKGTSISKFKLNKNTNYGLNEEVVETGKYIKKLIDSKEYHTYSFFDDNAFIIPLIIGYAPKQPFTFYQINKTLFFNKSINLSSKNIGNPDLIAICKSNDKINNSNYKLKYPNKLFFTSNLDKFSEDGRYFRIKSSEKEYKKAKLIFENQVKKYNKGYKTIFKNKKCLLKVKILPKFKNQEE